MCHKAKERLSWKRQSRSQAIFGGAASKRRGYLKRKDGIMDRQSQHKELIAPLRAAMYDFDLEGVRAVLHGLCAPDVVFRLAYPFESIQGVDAYVDAVYAP